MGRLVEPKCNTNFEKLKYATDFIEIPISHVHFMEFCDTIQQEVVFGFETIGESNGVYCGHEQFIEN